MENINKKYYCPTCTEELEMISSCGAVGYFCNHCRKLVSRQKMLSSPTDPPALALEEAPSADKSSETQ